MKETEDKLSGIESNTNPDEATVAAMKEKYGKLIKITVSPDDEDGDGGEPTHVLYFKKRYRQKKEIMMQAAAALQEKRMQKYIEIIIFNSLVNGDKIVKEDDDVFLALMPIADKFFTSYKAVLGK